jgi:hypothetical protein
MTRWYLAGLTTALILLLSAFSALPTDSTKLVPPHIPQAGPGDAELCPALPASPTGRTVTVSSVEEIWNAVNNAQEYDTILIASNTYNLGAANRYIYITTPNITIRSVSGTPADVVLDDDYSRSQVITILASNVTIADLTIKRAGTHPIHVITSGSNNTLNTLIYNVHIIDPSQQAIKINSGGSGYVDDGTVACSKIELTDAGRPHVDPSGDGCYTGGVDGHEARNWRIRDNLIQGFWCSSGLSEHGIHMWDNSANTVVERNMLVNNARGIGFGLGSSSHNGGIIRNNMVHVMQDVGIGLESSPNTRVYNNTVYTGNSYQNSIEYRFSATSNVEIINNLTNRAITLRDGSTGIVQNNVTNAQSGWFVNATTGDLHLISDSISTVINQGQTLTEVTDDFDGDARPIGSAADIGADEYGIPAPAAVTDLRVSHAITATGILTATLHWTPPANALTTTLRYATSPITAGNWNSAALLTGTLAGSANTYIASLPYSGGIIYFALKTTGAGGESGLSNNAFWPHKDIYLPLIFK